MVKAFTKMVQNYTMQLDHVSYVTSHEQIADTVQRLGSRISTVFLDGGIHPRFGTRNFTAPLKFGQYIEVVCPLDHPVTEQTPWGKAVTKKANEGGGWLTWVFSTNDITPIENIFGRKAIEGNRTRPDGTELRWKQIGVREISESRELPFFIEWLTNTHPSNQGVPTSTIEQIDIVDPKQLSDSWFKEDILTALGPIKLNWINPEESENQQGIVAVYVNTHSGIVKLD